MIYTDERIGNCPRYVLTDSPSELMEIPPEVMKCVVFLGYRLASGEERFAGSAVLLFRGIEELQGGFSYAVTARHVIDGIRGKGLDKVLLRVNQKSGNAKWIDTKLKDWHLHPAGKSVDVAVLQIALHEEYDHNAFPLKGAATQEVVQEEDIGVGNEVFVTGLFHPHYGHNNNIPIGRVGNIAAMTGEKVNTRLGPMDAYLIEARSIGGLSGSPVFLSFGHRRSIGGFAITPKQFLRFYILGVMHGHFDVMEDDLSDDFITASEDASGKKSVNMGIAIVVPIEKVIETIRQPTIAEEEDAVETAEGKESPCNGLTSER